MSSTFQTIAALVIVALTVTIFLWRAFAKRKTPGCGGACACPAADFKAKLKP